jgi:magnesium transporter
VAVGAVLGGILGAATATFVQFRHSILDMSLIIGVAMISVMAFSASIGTSLPLFFKRIGVDPAIATAPIVSTFCDILGILIYFSLATYLIT